MTSLFARRLVSRKSLTLLAIVAVLTGLMWLVSSDSGEPERKPLYWVSAMDPNYRSSQPGQCPHGMDLIPVYEEDEAQFGGGPGVVEIAAEVQLQMGVRTAPVSSGRLRQTLRVYGRVVPDRELMVKLSPRAAGWIEMLFVASVGETVKRGQPLYALYSPVLVAAQERFLEALQGDATDVRRAEAELQALNFDAAAIARLRIEGVAQRSVVFHAPKDGMVDMLNVSEQTYVKRGQIVMAIGSMETVWAELDVFESQASQIKPRQAVRLTTPAYPELIWDGQIDYIAPHLDSRARSLGFRVRLDNRRMQLRPNMALQGAVALPQRPPALLVPRQAVIALGHQNRVVLALGEGRFKSVAVSLGESNGEQVEVLEGLREGDEVVVSAHFLIDSESSKTSDFQRMEPVVEAEPEYPPVWTEATIEAIDQPGRTLRLQHEAIDLWGMPGMTMNFAVAEDLDMQRLRVGERVRVMIADTSPLFLVLKLQPVAAGTEP